MKPDERDQVVERLMEGLEPPQPPPELRSKTLAAARERMEAKSLPDVWSRVWNHRRLRLAWAAAAVLLLAGHVLLIPGKSAVLNPVEPALVAENRVDEQFIDMLRPVPISDNVQPIVGLLAASDSLADLDLEGNPS